MIPNPDKKEELLIKDDGNQAPINLIVEESKQIKEIGKQAPFQLGLEEVKQVQNEEQPSTSLTKKTIITGSLIFKENLFRLLK